MADRARNTTQKSFLAPLHCWRSAEQPRKSSWRRRLSVVLRALQLNAIIEQARRSKPTPKLGTGIFLKNWMMRQRLRTTKLLAVLTTGLWRFSADAGRQALAAAASSMPRGKATPHRALPAKIWSLFLKGHGKSQPGPTFRNAQMLHPMDIASSTCWMQLVKCSTKRPSNFSLILCYHTNTGMRPTDRAEMPSCN